EVAVSRGIGKILVDVRRGDGPADVRHFTFAAMVTTDAFIARHPQQVAAAVRAIVKAQQALRSDPSVALTVGQRKFPPDAAELIAKVVARDAEFYDPVISEDMIVRLNKFAQDIGHLSAAVPFGQVVAERFRTLWA